MIPLIEDGSLDVKRIRRLPFDERMKVVERLNDRQLASYIGYISLNEGFRPTIKAIHVDYGFDDERSGVDAFGFLEEMRRKYL